MPYTLYLIRKFPSEMRVYMCMCARKKFLERIVCVYMLVPFHALIHIPYIYFGNILEFPRFIFFFLLLLPLLILLTLLLVCVWVNFCFYFSFHFYRLVNVRLNVVFFCVYTCISSSKIYATRNEQRTKCKRANNFSRNAAHSALLRLASK